MAAFTIFHVLLSLVGIVTGFVVAFGLLARRGREQEGREQKGRDGWVAVFLITTIATSVTGFFFPFTRFLPSHGVGIVSLLVLPVAVVGRYVYHLRGPWRRAYAISSVLALYLNMFVLVVQLFLKIPSLQALAPTQTEPAFLVAQSLNLALFIWIGVASTLRSKSSSPSIAVGAAS